MLNPQIVTEIIRQRVGYPDDSQAARILAQIPEALKRTGRKVAADPALRPLMQSSPVGTSINLANDGALSLTTGFDTYQFLLEYFDLGQCYFVPSTTFNKVSGAPAPGLEMPDLAVSFGVGDAVTVSTTDTLPDPLQALTTYYILSYSGTDPVTGLSGFTLGTIQGDDSSVITITDPGVGTQTITKEMDWTPMQRLATPQQSALPNYLDSVFTYFFIQSNIMYVLPNTVTGSVKFAIPTYPTTLLGLPSSEEVEVIFLDELVELLMPAPNDAAQNGDK